MMVWAPKFVFGADELGYVPLHRLCASLHVHPTAHVREVLHHITMEWEVMRLVARHCVVVPTMAALAELLLAAELMPYLISTCPPAIDELHLIRGQLLMRWRLHVPCCDDGFPTWHRPQSVTLSSPLID